MNTTNSVVQVDSLHIINDTINRQSEILVYMLTVVIVLLLILIFSKGWLHDKL